MQGSQTTPNLNEEMLKAFLASQQAKANSESKFQSFSDWKSSVLANSSVIVPLALKVGETVKVTGFGKLTTKAGKEIATLEIETEAGKNRAIINSIPQLKAHLEQLDSFNPFEFVVQKEVTSESNGKKYVSYLVSFS